MDQPPSREEFLTAPLSRVREVAPATMILSGGGTRRRAVLEGISPTSEDFAHWTRRQMISCFDLVFRHGVRNLVMSIFAETTYRETTAGYRDKIPGWIDWVVAGPESLADYARLGWQVRLIGADYWPGLKETRRRLLATASADAADAADPPKLWFIVDPDPEVVWATLLEKVRTEGIESRAQAIRSIFGEDVPLATLYLDFGKPQLFVSTVPPLLVGNLQCYWRQHLGYDMDDRTFRTILYDYAYLRQTWKKDKSGRAEEILRYRRLFEDPPVLGLGERIGPFWYPTPVAAPDGSDHG